MPSVSPIVSSAVGLYWTPGGLCGRGTARASISAHASLKSTTRHKSPGKQVLSVLMGMVCLERATLEWGSVHWGDAALRKETLGKTSQNPHLIHETRGNLIFPLSWPGQPPWMLIWGCWSPSIEMPWLEAHWEPRPEMAMQLGMCGLHSNNS